MTDVLNLPRPSWMSEELIMLEEQTQKFFASEFAPHIERWNEQGIMDREVWTKMGQAGLLCAGISDKYGGAGGTFAHETVINRQIGLAGLDSFGAPLHSGIVAPYIERYGTEEQKLHWLPKLASGEMVGAIAMTEPGAGSDLANIQTRAVRDGDHYVVNGGKTFISIGQLGGAYVTAVKTDPGAKPAYKGVSLLVIEADSPGFVRGRKLEKLGFPAQDTSELFFEDCKVPAANLLGKEGEGFKMMMEKLQQERLCICITAIASCRRALDDTIAYTRERKAFGRAIAEFQNTQFTLAELATQVQVGQAFVDQLVAAHVRGDDIVSEVSMGKWWTTDLQKKVVGECLQLHGGYGFMKEYPISQDYADAAVQSIYAGTNEIMKVIIAKRLGLGS